MVRYTWVFSFFMMGMGALALSFMLASWGKPFRIVAVLGFVFAGFAFFIPDFRNS